MIRATCSVCGKTTKGGDDWAGRTAQCPSCQAPIYFPPTPSPPSIAPEATQYDDQIIPEVVAPSRPVADRRSLARAPEFQGARYSAKCYEIMGIIAGVIAGLLCLLQLALMVTRPTTLLIGAINLIVIVLSVLLRSCSVTLLQSISV